MVAIDLLLQVRHNRTLLHIAVTLRRAVDHISQRAETSRACQGSRSGLGAEGNGGCGAGGEELDCFVSESHNDGFFEM